VIGVERRKAWREMPRSVNRVIAVVEGEKGTIREPRLPPQGQCQSEAVA
jgi:hypothetical protein